MIYELISKNSKKLSYVKLCDLENVKKPDATRTSGIEEDKVKEENQKKLSDRIFLRVTVSTPRRDYMDDPSQ